MAVVGTIETKLTADISDLKSKLDAAVTKLNETGRASGNLTKAVFSGVAAWDLLKKGISMATSFIKGSISAFAEDETAVTRLQTASQKAGIAWSDMSKVMQTEVSRALKETTFSTQEVVSALAKLTTLGITGAKATDTLRIAQDTAAARGLNLSEVITGIIRGSMGYTRGLITLGLNIDSVKKSTDKEAEIIRQLTALYGGAAQAQVNTYAGRMKQLHNNIEEVRVTIASQLVPAINDVMKQMLGMTGEINSNIESQTKLQEIVFRVVEGFKFVGEMLLAVGNVFRAAGTVMVSPFLLLGSAIADVVKGLSKFPPKITFDNTKAMASSITDQWDEIGSNFNKISDGMTEDWKGMTSGMGFQFKEVGDNMTAIAEDTAEEVGDRFGDAIDKITDKLFSFGKSITDIANKHKEAIEKMSQDIEDLTADYERANQERQQSYDEGIAGIIKSHQDKVKTLEYQLKDETQMGKEWDEVKIAQTQEELKTEQDFLAKHASDAAAVVDEMGKDEIDLKKEQLDKEKENSKTAYDRRLADLKDQLIKENAAYDSSLADLGVSFKDQFDEIQSYIASTATPNIIAAFQKMVGLANVELAKLNQPLLTSTLPVTTTPTVATSAAISVTTAPTISTVQASLNEVSAKVAALIAEAKKSGLIPSFQMGGIISKTGPILAHAGEMVLPKGVSPNFSVNFYGDMSFNNEADENRFMDKLRKILMRDFETAKLGIY